MKLVTALRAFMAARFPAAWEEPMLLTHINRSGALDAPVTAEHLSSALSTLARMRDAECLVDPDGTAAWSATPHGVAAWREQGSPRVGG
jgi:hypothetical protein